MCDCGEQGIWPPADIALELGPGLGLYDLSDHLEKVGTGIHFKTCIVPPTYLDHLTSKVSSLNSHNLIIAIHETFTILPRYCPQRPRKLFKPHWHGGTEFQARTTATFDIENPGWVISFGISVSVVRCYILNSLYSRYVVYLRRLPPKSSIYDHAVNRP